MSSKALAAAPGAGGAPQAARGKPRGAGSVGLVADLSNKLARQRKQLDELVSQNAAKKSTWKWYHVLGLIMMNDLIVMVRSAPERAAASAAASAAAAAAAPAREQRRKKCAAQYPAVAAGGRAPRAL